VRPTSSKKVEHGGMKVQLLGQIELASDRHHPQDFVALGTSSLGADYVDFATVHYKIARSWSGE
jgi:hypothetical protein